LLPLLFPLSTFHKLMSQKRTAEEYNQTVQENGWVPGAHEEEDNRQQTKNEASERQKEPAGRPWIKWVM
jgi:hypothetical protein